MRSTCTLKASNRLLLLLVLCAGTTFGLAQPFIPGVPTFDSTEYVEYIPGNLPVIISAPHGGYLEPVSIPDRDCPGCVYLRDAYTQELARSISEAFFEQTGCYAHIVINLLHRKKFDANRDIGDAADGNPTVEKAWHAYHEFLDSAKARISLDYEEGLFLDLHGHGHTIQRIELGYLLSKTELQLPDSVLSSNAYNDKSSIHSLVENNEQSLLHAELLRGENSFGTLLENIGVPAVPSAADPFPIGSDPYFSGGYNTDRHGSLDGGSIDGIQIECHQDIRFDTDTREMFADSLTTVINEYINLHYNSDYQDNYCNLVSDLAEVSDPVAFGIFPNPASDHLFLDSDLEQVQVTLYNGLGQVVRTYTWRGAALDISTLRAVYYTVRLDVDGVYVGAKLLLKQE